MWLEDSDLMDRNAIRAGLADAVRPPVRRTVPRPPKRARSGPFTLNWLVGLRPRRAA